MYYGLMVIISWILIKVPIDNSVDFARDPAPKVDFSSIENNESTNITGPMWKISDEDSSIYLYSCFTLIADQIAGDKSIYPLSSTFDNALKDSDEIILYTTKYDRGDDDTDNLYFSLKKDSLDSHITKEAHDILMDKAKEVTVREKEDGINFYNYLTECKGGKTYYDVNKMLSPEELDFENGKYSTDEYLKYKAKEYNKKVDYMLNSSKLWIAVCNNDDNEINNAYAMLTKYLNEDYFNNMRKSFDYWKQGDNDKAYEVFNSFTFENAEDKNNYDKYNRIRQDDYNKSFRPFRDKTIDNISTYLKDNRKCFVSLDFKMLSGENNILKDLQDKGYKVEKIQTK